MKINLHGPLKGTTTVPGDKSITHRAIILGSLSEGRSTIYDPLLGEDCLSTIDVFKRLGVNFDIQPEEIIIDSPGWHNLEEPVQTLYTGNSGTTTRLLSGVMCGLPFTTVLSGDESIGRRPMERIIEPLRLMGANITGSHHNTRTPLIIQPASLHGIDFDSPVASAQVKSAVLLAGLFSDSETSVTEPMQSRNHTELMLPLFGVHPHISGLTVTIQPNSIAQLTPADVHVPTDISSAAFLIVAALIVPDSDITLTNIGVNRTRSGIIDIVQKMGGNIEVTNEAGEGEPSATIRVQYTPNLQPVVIEGEIIPRLIDELPIIALLLTQAQGQSEIRDAEELKVKETNRIDTVVSELNQLGFNLIATLDGMIVTNERHESSRVADSRGDHRIGMMLAIAALLLEEETTIEQFESVNVSFPAFLEILYKLGAK